MSRRWSRDDNPDTSRMSLPITNLTCRCPRWPTQWVITETMLSIMAGPNVTAIDPKASSSPAFAFSGSFSPNGC